jgi:xylan 1,4-beta-xylosidase
VPGEVYAVEILDQHHGNVAEAWHQLGEPLNLSLQQAADLAVVADDLDRSTLRVDDDGVLEIDIILEPWAVMSVSSATS